MKYGKIIFVCCAVASEASSQDYHVTQYDVAALYYNPAQTGFCEPVVADYRVAVAQRSQWQAVGVKPFSTSYLQYDMPLKKNERKFGVGGYLMNNSAGFRNFNTFSMMLSGAYDIINSRAKSVSQVTAEKHLLTAGVQAGFFYRSLNADRLNYDIQYSPGIGGFDEGLPSNESYNRLNMFRFDASYGIYYRMLDKEKKVRPYAGFSMSHLTRPFESITGGTGRMPIRWMFSTGTDIVVNEDVTLNPRVLYLQQSRTSEWMAGMLMYYKLYEKESELVMGLDWRRKDALIASLGIQNEAFTSRLSYDFNTSYLRNYTGGRGAFEISFVYYGKKKSSVMERIMQF
jgi:type IX secretion system PorP/SprF family membrane protein